MKEQLIQYFEQRLHLMDYMDSPKGRHICLDQCFGALTFAMQLTGNWDAEDELVKLWDEWKPILEEKVWGC